MPLSDLFVVAAAFFCGLLLGRKSSTSDRPLAEDETTRDFVLRRALKRNEFYEQFVQQYLEKQGLDVDAIQEIVNSIEQSADSTV